MNVARLNMSHGDYPDHATRLAWVRAAAAAVGRPIGVFADLQGPKIRLGRFGGGPVDLVPGNRFTITIEDVVGTVDRCSTTLKTLTQDVKPGDVVLIDDGKVKLQAIEVTATDVVCEVVVGGKVSNNKGINLPGVPVSVPALTEKDAKDLRWALQNGVDMVALSFVRNAKDVEHVHKIMEEEGRRVPVIAKVEKPQAVADIDDIIAAFDIIMVARGDLGVELPLDEVPAVQKRIITKARLWARPVIVATQMLESMINSPTPTRAEASDVANAILDGTDAVMLSGETAAGKYPIEAVSVMARIITTMENYGLEHIRRLDWHPHSVPGVITRAAMDVAESVEAKYIVPFTVWGDTALRISRLREDVPIVAFTPRPETAQVLSIAWGVKSFVTSEEHASTEAVVQHVEEVLLENNLVKKGDKVVIVTGDPGNEFGFISSLRVLEI